MKQIRGRFGDWAKWSQSPSIRPVKPRPMPTTNWIELIK